MSLRNRFSSAGFAHLLKVAGPGILAFAFIATAAAQIAHPIPEPPTSLANPIMGFETPEGWIVKSSSPATRVSSTTTRTQGSFALALVNPASGTTMTSLHVPSTAGALAGVDDVGAIFEVDVMPPAPHVDAGSLKLSVSSPSRGLKNELIGEVELKGLRGGIYSTLKFPIPEKVRSDLGGATFEDLSFEFVLTLPPGSLQLPIAAPPQFLFDNLRVHALPLVTAKPGIKPPAGYGGSVDLVTIGGEPATQSFSIGAVQIPDSFHLEQGTAGTTKVKLALGYDGNSAFTCTYDDGPTEKNGASYVLNSCTGGFKAGDLVGANFAQLIIVGGNSSMKLRAQLAKNPIGDLVGSDVIPPMPTFWGNFDGCQPAPVPGKVHTVSPGCAAQIAEANQIVTDYFNKVSDAKSAFNWIVTPTPDRARRHGNGLPNPNQPGNPPHITPLSPPPQSNDITFDKEGHMNPGGDFDAFWRLNGDFNNNNDQASGNSTTDFDAAFSGHVVIYGQDVNVVSVNATAHTASGSSPTATGSLHMFLFGLELPGGGSADASTGFNFNISQSTEFDLPPIPIWIFSITPGATASVGVVASGTLAATGISLAVSPEASLGAHVLGGIDIPGQVSGGVDARIDLLDVLVPLTAKAGWSIDTLPQSCATTVNFALKGDVQISAGGGEIDLVATIGPCPFCWSDSWTLFSWPPLVTTVQTLFDSGPTTLAAIPLPTFLCAKPINISILSPTLSAVTGIANPLTGFDNAGFSDCNNYKWSVNAPDTLSPASGQGCNVSATFNALGSRTLSLSVVDNITDQFGRTISETGSTSESLNVSLLAPGSYISATNPANLDNLQGPFNGKFLSFLVGSFPTVIQLTGEVIGFSGTTSAWTFTDSSGKTTSIGKGLTVNWTVPTFDTYTITMTTTDSGGHVVGTASMQALVELTPR
jgi:hypothetical protein